VMARKTGETEAALLGRYPCRRAGEGEQKMQAHGEVAERSKRNGGPSGSCKMAGEQRYVHALRSVSAPKIGPQLARRPPSPAFQNLREAACASYERSANALDRNGTENDRGSAFTDNLRQNVVSCRLSVPNSLVDGRLCRRSKGPRKMFGATVVVEFAEGTLLLHDTRRR